LLATGAHNGKTRIWSSDGEIKHTFQYHKGPVFSVCWNPTSQFLLSAGIDKTVAIWDVQNEQKKQQIRLHDDAILDACWKDETMFATCSADLKICLTRVGENHSFVTFKGHTSAVNSIKWDPSRKLLASCSDDHTIRIWDTTKALEEVSSTTTTENTSSTSPPITTTVAAAAAGTTTTENKNSITESSSSSSSPNSKMSSKNFLVHTLAEHEKEVYTIRWSPPNAETLSLASASFDHTVKIWDISTGTCTRTFEHQDAVHGVEYSPNGTFLASGTVNGRVYVWSLKVRFFEFYFYFSM
jgi:transducin (beta)-like 1